MYVSFLSYGLPWISSARIILGKLGAMTSVANKIFNFQIILIKWIRYRSLADWNICFFLFQRAELGDRSSSFRPDVWLSYPHHWRLITLVSHRTFLFRIYPKIWTCFLWPSFSLPSRFRCPQNSNRVLIGIFLSQWKKFLFVVFIFWSKYKYCGRF